VFWTGISLAVYTGQLVPIIDDTIPGDDTNDKFMKSMFAMVALGIGEMVGGLFIGQIIDRYGNKKAAMANILLISL
jgi:MFS family permease